MTKTLGNIVINSKIWFPIKDFDTDHLERLKSRLTIYPRVSTTFNKDNKSVPVELYSEYNGMIGVPRAYGYSLAKGLGYDMSNAVDLRTDETGSIDFNCNLELWDTQINPAADVWDKLNTEHNGTLLMIGCGGGKTVIALHTISRIKAPTMVILHDGGLLSQWIQEAKSILGLKDEEIGIVRQDKCDFKGKKIVFATTQSIHSRADSYPKDLFMWPTFVIYDEVHRTGAQTFCTWMNLMRPKYVLGLTATPRRWDGAEDVFYYNIGEVGAEGIAKRMIPKIFLVRLPYMVPDIKTSTGMPLVPIMLSKMCGTKTPKGETKAISAPNSVSIRRNTYIGKDSVSALKSGRRVLILSNRIPQLEELRKFIAARVDCTIGWYIGGMSNKERQNSKDCQLILATYKLGSEGMDVPRLDTLILASPISDIEQSVGRILRFSKEKQEPFVLDYVDPNPAFKNMLSNRVKFYDSQNYKITNVVKS